MGSPDGPTDRELWRLADDGDGAAFGQLFTRHATAVYNHLFRRTANWAEAVATAVDSERRMAQVRQALTELPRHEREVVELVAWSGLDQKAAAVALGVSLGTVKSRLHRARQHLATRLNEPAAPSVATSLPAEETR